MITESFYFSKGALAKLPLSLDGHGKMGYFKMLIGGWDNPLISLGK